MFLVSSQTDARRGGYTMDVVTNHASGEDTACIARLPVQVLDALVPWQAEAAEWEAPSEEQRARIRKSANFAMYAQEGEDLDIRLANIRVTHYTDTMSYRLVGPEMSVLAEGEITVDGEREISHEVEQTGTHYLEVVPNSGSADARISIRPVAEVATKESPLQLFCSPITRYFYVPEGSEGFSLGARDGGPMETARFVITSPTGRVAFEADGNFAGEEHRVEVKPQERGQLWTLRVEPRQDISFWLTGDVMPYLSTSPERALVGAGVR